ncbi:hypothetical protein B0H13DRAFT_2667476 [Mycena leptocephala]|nr:hypothetical protein B0H13DRAFT_2667476 [Mycena leptocephala]
MIPVVIEPQRAPRRRLSYPASATTKSGSAAPTSSSARSCIRQISRCAGEGLTARPKDERRSTRHVICPPGRTSTTAAAYPATNLGDSPLSASISARKTVAPLARPLSTKTLVPPKDTRGARSSTGYARRPLLPWGLADSPPGASDLGLAPTTTQAALPLAPTVSAQRQRRLESSISHLPRHGTTAHGHSTLALVRLPALYASAPSAPDSSPRMRRPSRHPWRVTRPRRGTQLGAPSRRRRPKERTRRRGITYPAPSRHLHLHVIVVVVDFARCRGRIALRYWEGKGNQ